MSPIKNFEQKIENEADFGRFRCSFPGAGSTARKAPNSFSNFPTAWRDFCGSKKNSVYWFDLFFYVRNDSASGVEDFGILFFANRQFFLKFSKIGKKSIWNHFSCIFPYREVIGKIEKKTPLSTIYMVKNMPSKCLENARFYFLCFLLKK